MLTIGQKIDRLNRIINVLAEKSLSDGTTTRASHHGWLRAYWLREYYTAIQYGLDDVLAVRWRKYLLACNDGPFGFDCPERD